MGIELILMLVMGVAGLLLGGLSLAFFGALLGYLLGISTKHRRQIRLLQRHLTLLESKLADLTYAPVKSPPGKADVTPATARESSSARESDRSDKQQPHADQDRVEAVLKSMPIKKAVPARPIEELSSAPVATRASAPRKDSPERPPKAKPQPPGIFDSALKFILDYFRGGNLIVRIGVIVLFFGISFLLKYAAENTQVPIELRLAAVAAAAIVLLIFGWRLRNRRQNYGLVLQGGAVGILYLTVFSALRLYSVLPAGAALAFMLVFVALSALLALLQNARSLAVLGSIGGFLAPLLVSTGEGSHVTLFAYYLLLNAGVLAIAWVKSWRLLNLVGFGFTFVIGSVWGLQYYDPRYFATTEPFLIAFFLLYVAVSVLFAHTQPLQRKGLVDGALVFGTPVAVAGLQAALVRDTEYGLAISAVLLGAFYIVLAGLLVRRSGSPLRTLAESFLAIGVVFVTLSIPFALDGRISAAFWALEGAAAVWLGLRQAHLLPRVFGVALQFLAGLIYLSDLRYKELATPLFNGEYLGAVLIAAGGLIIAFLLDRYADKRHPLERWLPVILFVWGLLWWLGGNTLEILAFSQGVERWAWLLMLAIATAAGSEILRARLSWPRLAQVALGLLPALVLLALVMAAEQKHLLEGWATPAWLLAVAVLYGLRKRFENVHEGLPEAPVWWHAVAFWLLLSGITLEVSWRLDQWLDGALIWRLIPWGAVPVVAGFALYGLGRRILWPLAAHYRTYTTLGLLPVTVALLLWVVLVNAVSSGQSTPLPYLPVFNPTDLGILFVLFYLLRWWHEVGDWLRTNHVDDMMSLGLIGALTFYWLNGLVVRTVHHWAGVPFDGSELLRSQVLQTSFTVLWALCGLGCMLVGTAKHWRYVWMAGAGLMAVVVIKLFAVDLSGTGTVERIVSFIGVGVLLLIVGWFSPVPPREERSVS